MSNRRFLIGSNWKMNKTVGGAIEYTRRLLKLLETVDSAGEAQIFVIPPFTAIEAVKRESAGKLWVGAQNMHWAEWGPYTGEVSAPMLKELGVDLVQLGHAERRLYFNETDEAVNRKLHTALSYGFRALICVGEGIEQKQDGTEKEGVAKQLRAILNGTKLKSASNIIIAYEPLWAIGEEGSTADSTHIRMMSKHIRRVLDDRFGPEIGAEVLVIYGGDVNARNAPELLDRGDINGLFVGRAAWQAESFANLIRACVKPAV